MDAANGAGDELFVDVAGIGRPTRGDVDRLVRLQLDARRCGRSVRLTNVGEELELVLRLTGLGEVMGLSGGLGSGEGAEVLGADPQGQPEQREQALDIEIVADPGDPPL
jgi:hypothetical protein